MHYEDQKVIKAFRIYSQLLAEGMGEKDVLKHYIIDDDVRGLVDQFAEEVQSTVFIAGDYIYMLPKATASVFHISNESIKRDYLPSKSLNSDIYLMYVATIILFGEFYDGYQSMNPTRDFMDLDHWLNAISERIFSLKEYDIEQLKELEKEYEYNWIDIINKWDPLDDLKENVKTQDARTQSRISFLNITKNFLLAQGLIKELGNDEIELTEKAKIIIQRYYMEYEFNRGLLDFMYQVDRKREED
ncbi:hypothetical protein EDC19_1349 [Natranaerovirga hydrolytica]|uniref:Non-ribosomal peptide synthetase module n=1 Tax=Natranaerovirga hydrolytica TaxID=680378 RepID=A0A4R1MMP3_9FIRM|nr:DUF6063 family protein [Natranaerovirga hydrolytica]TCK93162.1 hypothetical protein EDC19_1349 [Natranaerovirga hydrolytica]